jgi:hypothetical protein
LKDIAELFKDSWRTIRPTGRGRKSTLCLERHVSDFRKTLAKSTPDQTCTPGVLAQNGHRQIFSGGRLKNARTTRSQRNLNRPQAPALVSDCKVPSHRSPLPDCKGQKKLLAIVPSV